MLLLLRPPRIRPTRIYLWPSNARIHEHAHVCTHNLRLFYFSLGYSLIRQLKKNGSPTFANCKLQKSNAEGPSASASSFSCSIISFPTSTHWLSWNRRLPLHRPHMSLSLLLPCPPQACSLLAQVSPNTPAVRELSQSHS